jgi:phosphate-selective porin OprO/OprP
MHARGEPVSCKDWPENRTLDLVPASVRGFLPVFLFAISAAAQTPFDVHAYVQGRFTNQEGTTDRLEVRRARVIFSGTPVSDLSYSFQVDVAKTPYILDAALTWKFPEDLRVTAGQFKIPFSTESLIADNLEIAIARSRAVNSLAPGRDTGVQGRDTGIQIAGSLHHGNGPLLEYAAGVFRGQTLIESPAIHYQSVAGRVLLHPLHGLTIGGDWYGSFSSPGAREKRRSDAEGGYGRGRLTLRAEQVWARDGTLQRRGGYLLGVWRFSKGWEGLTRADWLTANAHKANSTSIAYIAGANYYWRKYVKVGFNSGAQHDQGPKGFSSIVLAQVMLSY